MFRNVDHQLLDALNEIKDTVTMATEDANGTYTKINLLVEDLNDYMDEHSMHDSYITVEDIDKCIKHVEEVRSRFRELHRHLKETIGETEYNDKYLVNYQENLTAMKEYIKAGKVKVADIRGSQDKGDLQARRAQEMKDNEAAVQKEDTS